MDLPTLKQLAEKCRANADDKTALTKLAADTHAKNAGDKDACSLVDQCKAAADGTAVRKICDAVKVRTA